MTIQACLRILELDQAHNADQIHRAYRRQVKRWHPDQFTHQPAIHAEAEERLKQINHAYAVLKEHLKNNLADQTVKDTASEKPSKKREEAARTKPQKSSEPFRWSQWFKPKKSKGSTSKKEDGKTATKAEPTRADDGFKAKAKTKSRRKRPSFEKILRAAADHPKPPSKKSRTGARPLFNPNLYKRRKKGLRVEGFKPTSPITPIRPVPKVSRIEGSD